MQNKKLSFFLLIFLSSSIRKLLIKFLTFHDSQAKYKLQTPQDNFSKKKKNFQNCTQSKLREKKNNWERRKENQIVDIKIQNKYM